MDISKFLAKVIGIYLVLISIAFLCNEAVLTNTVVSLVKDAPLMFLTGLITLILGILIVVSHNVWQWNWRVIITLIGWLTLLKGLTILFQTHVIDDATTAMLNNSSILYVSTIIDLVLGLILVFFGFKRT